MMSESLNKLSSLDGATEVYCTHEYTLANLAFATAADPSNEKLRMRLAVEQEKRELGQPTLPSTDSVRARDKSLLTLRRC